MLYLPSSASEGKKQETPMQASTMGVDNQQVVVSAAEAVYFGRNARKMTQKKLLLLGAVCPNTFQ
jgi:hypothetical protein